MREHGSEARRVEPSKDGDPRDRVAFHTAWIATAVALFVAQFGGPAWLDAVPLLAAGVAGGYRLGYDEKRKQAAGWAVLAMFAVFGLLYLAVHLTGDPMSETAPWPLSDVGTLQVASGSCVKIERTIGSSDDMVDAFTGSTLSDAAKRAKQLAKEAEKRRNGRSRTAWLWQVDRWTDQVDAGEPDPDRCDTAKNWRLAAAGIAVGTLVLIGVGDAAVDAVRGGIGKH